MTNTTVIPHKKHSLSHKDISKNARKELKQLEKAAFSAYLVGGGVRDLLLGGHPKDFDVATSAHPDEVRALFRNCRLIGRRFRLAHIFFGREIVEVATFRASHDQAKSEEQGMTKDGMIIRDNVYGTIEEDALRRDFRINALYYNLKQDSVTDFADGLKDIENKIVRLIGDPTQRRRIQRQTKPMRSSNTCLISLRPSHTCNLCHDCIP